jgi:hypothetical protein
MPCAPLSPRAQRVVALYRRLTPTERRCTFVALFGPRVRKAARDAEILRLRRAGWLYKRLAARFGMTAEAVRKVCKRGGL